VWYNPIIFLFSIRKLAVDRIRRCLSLCVRRAFCCILFRGCIASPTLTKGTRTNFVGHQFRTGWIISDTQIALAIYKNYLPQSFTMAVEANWSERGATPHWHVLNECRPHGALDAQCNFETQIFVSIKIPFGGEEIKMRSFTALCISIRNQCRPEIFVLKILQSLKIWRKFNSIYTGNF